MVGADGQRGSLVRADLAQHSAAAPQRRDLVLQGRGAGQAAGQADRGPRAVPGGGAAADRPVAEHSGAGGGQRPALAGHRPLSLRHPRERHLLLRQVQRQRPQPHARYAQGCPPSRAPRGLCRHVRAGDPAQPHRPGSRFVEAFVYRAPEPEVDVEALQLEAETIRLKLDGLAQDHILGLVDKSQLRSGTQAGRLRLEAIDRTLSASVVESPLLSLVGIENVGEVWQAQPLSSKRFVLDTLMEVTLHTPARRGPRFDTASIGIRFRDTGELEAAA